MEQNEATKQLATAIRALLVLRGRSQMDVARALGWSQSACQRRLAGDQVLTVPELVAIAAYLDVQPARLLEVA